MSQVRRDKIIKSTADKKNGTNEFDNPNPKLIELFQNKYHEEDYVIVMQTSEFTCFCPLTGQPDFAKIQIKYIPDQKCMESNSLKLYLLSFRNFSAMNEECINRILEDYVKAVKPRWMQVNGNFNDSGGISISIATEYVKRGFELPHLLELREP